MYVNFGVLVLGHLTVLYDTCNCAKDLLEWTIILLDMGCMDLGGGGEALATLRKMQHEGVAFDEVAFSSIVYAWGHS